MFASHVDLSTPAQALSLLGPICVFMVVVTVNGGI